MELHILGQEFSQNYGKLPFSILEIILSKNNQTSGLILEYFSPENGTQIKIFIHFQYSLYVSKDSVLYFLH